MGRREIWKIVQGDAGHAASTEEPIEISFVAVEPKHRMQIHRDQFIRRSERHIGYRPAGFVDDAVIPKRRIELAARRISRDESRIVRTGAGDEEFSVIEQQKFDRPVAMPIERRDVEAVAGECLVELSVGGEARNQDFGIAILRIDRTDGNDLSIALHGDIGEDSVSAKARRKLTFARERLVDVTRAEQLARPPAPRCGPQLPT